MIKKNFYFTFYLFILGVSGIFSLLTVPFNFESLPDEVVDLLQENFTEIQLRFLSTINPMILLCISLLIGFLVNRTQYKRSLLFSYISKIEIKEKFTFYLFKGLFFGFLSSLMVAAIYFFFKDREQIKLMNEILPDFPLITKILYGGITEEIIARWGWLSLFHFLAYKIFKKHGISIVLSIIFSASLFSVGHLPIVYQYLGNSIETGTVIYILLNNFLLGCLFGYLYLRYNLETAFVAHICFHLLNYLLLLVFFN